MQSLSRAGLLERDGELARIREVSARTAEGHGGGVVVEGPAGIGKTRLLEAVRGLAADASLAVAWARGSELEREYGFGLLRQLLEPGQAEGADALAPPAQGVRHAPASRFDRAPSRSLAFAAR